MISSLPCGNVTNPMTQHKMVIKQIFSYFFQRIQNCVAKMGVPIMEFAWEILALAFTNATAKDVQGTTTNRYVLVMGKLTIVFAKWNRFHAESRFSWRRNIQVHAKKVNLVLNLNQRWRYYWSKLPVISLDLCANVVCEQGSFCKDGECVCPKYCNEEYRPICGSDGQTVIMPAMKVNNQNKNM